MYKRLQPKAQSGLEVDRYCCGVNADKEIDQRDTSVMDGLHVADARMHSDATNATRLACSASYSLPILGSTRASILPSLSSGRAWRDVNSRSVSGGSWSEKRALVAD